MYQHGTIFSLNNRWFIYMVLEMRGTYTNSIIKVHLVIIMCMLVVKSFIHTKIEVVHHFEKVSMFTGQNSHTRLVLL